MTDNNFDSLKLKDQLCFPLYACSRELIKTYKPHLDKMELTYTQYIVMMVLWEKKTTTVKELGTSLYLDSGTLTPLLKKLEARGYITRKRSEEDERNLIVSLTPDGEKLRDSALHIPAAVYSSSGLKPEEAQTLYELLYKVLGNISE